MKRVLVCIFAVGLFFSACGDDDSSSPEPVAGESAEDALKRQIQFLEDGQTRRAYEEIHPAQQELFTADQYAACVGESVGGLEFEEINVKETYTEEVKIPGTDLTVDSTALTVEMVTNMGTDTDTFHEFDVNGEWKFTVADVQEIVDATC